MSPDEARTLVIDRAKDYHDQKARTAQVRNELVEALKQAQTLGVPELRLSREAKLSRMSIRRWLGKSSRT